MGSGGDTGTLLRNDEHIHLDVMMLPELMCLLAFNPIVFIVMSLL